MPGRTESGWRDSAGDDTGPRFRPPPAVAPFVPVVLAFVIQVGGTIAVSAWQRIPLQVAVWSVVLAAASALALLGARRWPGPTVAVVAALTAADLFVPPDAGPPFLALAFAIIGAGVRGARTWALASVGIAWLAAVVGAGIVGTAWHPFRVALATVGIALCFVVGEGIRTRFARGRARREQLAERRRIVEQEERQRIARELHDVLAHSLSQIAVQSGVGLHLFDREPERAREALASIRSLSATGLDEVRGVLSFLRGEEAGAPATAPLTPQPQLADLPALAAQRSVLGLAVEVDDRLDEDRPPGAVQTTAYRIAQEALTNVVRHSGGSRARVVLERSADELVVAVSDDGSGLPVDAPEGGGIRGMRERAQLAGGSLEIAAADPAGTVVTARLPWTGAP